MEVIDAPVDVRVDVGEPTFAENEIVFLEWVQKSVDGVGVAISFENDGCRMVGDGESAIRKNDGNGGT